MLKSWAFEDVNAFPLWGESNNITLFIYLFEGRVLRNGPKRVRIRERLR